MSRRRAPLLPTKFHIHRYNDKGIGHKSEMKFLLIFDQIVEYKRPTGAYPMRDFHKICRICTSFQDAVKASLDLLKQLWSYGSFNLTGLVTPKFSVPPSGETMHQTPKFWRCTNVLEVLYHHAKFGGARFSPAAGAAKNVEFFVCPSRF